MTVTQQANLIKEAYATSERLMRRSDQMRLAAECWARVAAHYRSGDMAAAKKEIAKADKLASRNS